MRVAFAWRLLLLSLAAAVLCGSNGITSPLSPEDRVAAQQAVEEIRWRHRIWPESNPRPKPSLAEVLPEVALRSRAEEGQKKSAALERFWGVQVSGRLIQAEIDRMVKGSRAPEVLQEMFAALGNDPDLIAEIIARPLVADRLLRERYDHDDREPGMRGRRAGAGRVKRAFDDWWGEIAAGLPAAPVPDYDYTIPAAPVGGCVDGTWSHVMTDLPFGREYHTAIWTGSEMIVWGGWGADSAVLSSGARYDPALDSWVPTRNDSSAPPGRYRHAAVWTGTEMMVWGGRDDTQSTYTNTGALYNPLTDSWRPTRVDANTPSGYEHQTGVWTGGEAIFYGGPDGGGRYNPATDTWTKIVIPEAGRRSGQTAVWTGTEMLIWGGGTSQLGLTNIGWRYNPATGIWNQMPVTSATPAGRSYHTAVWTGSEMIVWGGNGSSASFNSGGRFNPATNSWASTRLDGSTPAPRGHGTAVWTGSAMVVWGGTPYPSLPLSSGGVYDPANDSWHATRDDASTPSDREAHTAVWTGSQMIVWGGYSPAIGFVNTGGRYDPAADTWLPTGIQFTAPTQRFDHTAVWTGSEMMIWGGRGGTGYLEMQSGAWYDPATDSWTATSINASTPSARGGQRAVWTGTEMIVWGGYINAGAGLALGGGRYNPQTDMWAAVRADASAPVPRTDHTAVWTGREMIVWGGNDPTTLSSYTGGLYDPVTDSWKPTRADGTQPFYRSNHTAVWTGREMIIFGGYGPIGGDGMLNTGGRYDPRTDLWTPTSTATLARLRHSAVWTGSEMIVWGGTNGTTSVNSGARYDPVTNSWTTTSITASTPAPQSNHTAVWTGREMIIWFSGGGRYDPATDTWATVRRDWTSPSTQGGHAAIWDGNEMIVWGGHTNTGGGLCACPGAVSTYYQDEDGDGHGLSSVSVPSCVPLSGYAAQGGDCGDLDPGSWGVPGEVRDLMFDDQGSIAWLAPVETGGLSSAVRYDLIRSAIPSNLDSAATCVATDSTEVAALDPEIPPAGGFFYYVARAGNGCPGEGTLGTDSSGTPRMGRGCP